MGLIVGINWSIGASVLLKCGEKEGRKFVRKFFYRPIFS